MKPEDQRFEKFQYYLRFRGVKQLTKYEEIAFMLEYLMGTECPKHISISTDPLEAFNDLRKLIVTYSRVE